MKKEIKQISIKHPVTGEIIIHSEVDEKYNDLIGKFGDGGGKNGLKYYNGNICENENGTFLITDLKVLKSESFNVGWHKTNGGSKNFIDIFTNKHVPEDSLVIYPNAVLSVIYQSMKK